MGSRPAAWHPAGATWVSKSMRVMANASPTFSSFTFALVWMRVGAMPARESCATNAMVKQPAWAAPINSSGFVADWPSSNRDLNEYGPSKAHHLCLLSVKASQTAAPRQPQSRSVQDGLHRSGRRHRLLSSYRHGGSPHRRRPGAKHIGRDEDDG